MPVSHSGDRRREKFGSIQRGDLSFAGRRPPLVSSSAAPPSEKAARVSVVGLGKSSRVSLMLTPDARGSFEDQARETLCAMAALLQETPNMQVTSQTVFLKEPSTQAQCEKILAAHHGSKAPLTNFVFQP